MYQALRSIAMSWLTLWTTTLSASATPLASTPAPSAATSPALRTSRIEQALGRRGRDIGGGVLQVTVPRAETITEMGHYMHLWATGDPATVAQGLRAALDGTNSGKPAGSN